MFEEVLVRQRTLDALVPAAVDMLKVDVEGFELDVLRGASEMFDRNPHMSIMCEVAPAYLRETGVTLDHLLGVLPSFNRSLWIIDDHLEANPFGGISRLEDIESWMFGEASPLWYANLLSVRREVETEVLALADELSG